MKKLTGVVGVLLAAVLALVLVSSAGQSQSATGSVHPSGWGATPNGFAAPRTLTTVPTAAMYDAVTVGNIPGHPFAVAGYPFGLYVTWPAILRGFPLAHHISIAVGFFQRAMCGDFEPGDMTDSEAGPWAKADIAAGFPLPCQYGDLSNMPAIQASDRATFGANWRAHVLLWLAWYRKTPGLIPGYDAVQYDDTCLGRNLDCNTVTLNFLKIAQPPYVTPPPPPPMPVCFFRRMTVAQCDAVRTQLGKWARAQLSSIQAYDAQGCPVLWNRIQWFSAHLAAQPTVRTAYRRAALAASRRVFLQRGCAVFIQRWHYFDARIAALEAAS